MDLFLFGTLLYLPLLEEVSGVPDVAAQVQRATRRGFQVSRVDGQVFPVMHENPQAVAEGVIVQGLDEDALARLDYYEKAFDYSRVDFEVVDDAGATRHVTSYVPETDRWTPAEPWDKDGWIAEFGAMTVMAARDAMVLYGKVPAQVMGERFGPRMAQASSRLRAQSEAKDDGFGRKDVQVVRQEQVYSGFFTVDELDVAFRRFDGTMSDPMNRGVFVSVDCAVVLPYDPVRDRVLLIEQFRPANFVRGGPNPWCLEPVAGRIDPGETPEQSAIREGREEAGVEFKDLRLISSAFPSPGTSTEYLFIYLGLCDLPDTMSGVGGLEEEGEDIRSHVMKWAEFDADLTAGRFSVLPLVVAGHWLARHREALRAQA